MNTSVKVMNLLIFLLSAALLPACSGKMKFQDKPSEPTRSEKEYISEAQEKLDNGNYTEAGVLLDKFMVTYPSSLYLTAAKLGQARVIEAQGKPEQAIGLYKQIIKMTKEVQPTIAAEAAYRSSYSYELLKNDVKALSSLKDAENFGASLSKDIKDIEIPARRAQLFAKSGLKEDALKEIRKTDESINSLIAGTNQSASKSWVGRMYYQIGMVNLVRQNEDEFIASLQALNVSQKYHLKCIETADGLWSAKSMEYLKTKYQEAFAQIQFPTVASGIDPEVQRRMQREKQVRIGVRFLEVLAEAARLEPYERSNKDSSAIFAYIESIAEKTQALVYLPTDSTSLTQESLQLNGIKRSGQILDQGSPK